MPTSGVRREIEKNNCQYVNYSFEIRICFTCANAVDFFSFCLREKSVRKKNGFHRDNWADLHFNLKNANADTVHIDFRPQMCDPLPTILKYFRSVDVFILNKRKPMYGNDFDWVFFFSITIFVFIFHFIARMGIIKVQNLIQFVIIFFFTCSWQNKPSWVVA